MGRITEPRVTEQLTGVQDLCRWLLVQATTAVEECPEGAPSERRNNSLIEFFKAGYIKQPVNGN